MTLTASRATARPGPSRSGTARSSLAGLGTLVRFDLRRDRLRIIAWLAGITLLSVMTAGSFEGLYVSVADRQGVAATMDSPAGLAMTGPREYLADYNLGSMMGHQMLGFTAVLVALMSLFMVVRHTRAEEESGRAELIRATVVGRHAHLSAALVLTVSVNVLLALLIAVTHGAIGIEGMTWSGSVLYGAAHAAVGVVFAGVAAVTAQIMEHPRGASGSASAVLGAAYVVRAVGDAGNQTVSWLSPIGWAQATYVYVENRWWPLALCAVLAVALAGAAFVLSTRRDVGAGMRASRPGRPEASRALLHPVGFSLRLHRSVLIGFAVALVLTGISYGSFLADVEEMLANVDGMDEVIAAMGGATVVESFLSMVTVVMSIIAAVFVVLAVLRARSEENAGRAEPLLATKLQRTRWLASHVAVAIVGGGLLLLLAAAGLAGAGVATTGETDLVATAIGASLAYLPAHWVTAGVVVALYGWVPRLAPLAWVVPAYAFLVGYLGEILQFPDWLKSLSPFSVVPKVPAADLSWTPLLGLTGLALALLLVGFAGFNRRDVGGR